MGKTLLVASGLGFALAGASMLARILLSGGAGADHSNKPCPEFGMVGNCVSADKNPMTILELSKGNPVGKQVSWGGQTSPKTGEITSFEVVTERGEHVWYKDGTIYGTHLTKSAIVPSVSTREFRQGPWEADIIVNVIRDSNFKEYVTQNYGTKSLAALERFADKLDTSKPHVPVGFQLPCYHPAGSPASGCK